MRHRHFQLISSGNGVFVSFWNVKFCGITPRLRTKFPLSERGNNCVYKLQKNAGEPILILVLFKIQIKGNLPFPRVAKLTRIRLQFEAVLCNQQHLEITETNFRFVLYSNPTQAQHVCLRKSNIRGRSDKYLTYKRKRIFWKSGD